MSVTFRTHTGETVTGDRLRGALAKVASDWRELAHAIRKEDAYASHVTTETKEDALRDMLARADGIETGDVRSFTIWQRVNQALTGECVALLGKSVMSGAPRIGRANASTWLGRPGEVYAVHYDADATGRRVTVHTWHDGSGEVEITAMRGDGRSAGYVRLESRKLINPSAETISETVAALALRFDKVTT